MSEDEERKRQLAEYMAKLKASGMEFGGGYGGLILPKWKTNPLQTPPSYPSGKEYDMYDALEKAWEKIKHEPPKQPVYSFFSDFLKSTTPSPFAFKWYDEDAEYAQLAPPSAAQQPAPVDVEPPLKPKPAVCRMAKAGADDLCALMDSVYNRRNGFPSRLPGDFACTSPN